jgi:hypothetical protein
MLNSKYECLASFRNAYNFHKREYLHCKTLTDNVKDLTKKKYHNDDMIYHYTKMNVWEDAITILKLHI